MLTRDEVPTRVSELMGGKVVRWKPLDQPPFAFFEGVERTLEVFDTEVRERRRLYDVLEPEWPELYAAAGGHIVLLFYNAEETARYFPDLSRRRASSGA